jgi:uncharacterized membrane protein YphA (DoxX/SURF4 family)
MFTTFPGEWPGVGLLLLRTAVGGFSISLGLECLLHSQASLQTGMAASGLVLCGSLLLIGYLTPLAAGMVAMICAGSAFSWLPAGLAGAPGERWTAVLRVAFALAVLCLGPGAFSLDARLFGRREIIFPSRPKSE